MPFYLVRCWQRVRRKVPCDLDFLWFVAWLFVSMPIPFLLWLLLHFQCRGIAKAHIGPKTVIDFLHTLAHEVPLNKNWELSSDLQSSAFDNPFIPHKWDILKCPELYVWVCVYMCMYWWCMSLNLAPRTLFGNRWVQKAYHFCIKWFILSYQEALKFMRKERGVGWGFHIVWICGIYLK